MTKIKNDIFLRACRLEKTARPPIWIMRQAGRYLPQYQKVREKYDFMTMYRTPELAAEITLQPVDYLNTDAAIIFSDILVIPEAMGLKLNFYEGKGPVFESPVSSAADIKKLKNIDVKSHLAYMLDAIGLAARQIDGSIPLIGFCGSPWTLFSYMIEGSGSKNLIKTKRFLYNQKEAAITLLEMLSDILAEFLSAQIEAGANALQIFDSFAGALSPFEYEQYSGRFIKKIISNLRRNCEPVIVFAKGAGDALSYFNKTEADVVSVDWTVSLSNTRKLFGGKKAVQGNMEPMVLFGNENTIFTEAENIIKSYGNYPGHIFNLGHGILPGTDPAKAKALVEFVQNYKIKNLE